MVGSLACLKIRVVSPNGWFEGKEILRFSSTITSLVTSCSKMIKARVGVIKF